MESSVSSNEGEITEQEMEFEEYFKVSSFLKKGHFGDIYRCIERESDKEYAVKILTPLPNDELNEDEDYVKFSREGTIWRRLKHRNIVELTRVFKSPTAQYLILEYVKDGNLFDQVVNFTTYTERDICYFMKQLFDTLAYLREKRVIHRDIKPDNLLLKQTSCGEILKLTDFGLAVRLDKGKKFVKMPANGAPLQLAPETILEKPVNYAVDAWSAGTILFTLLGGYPPFYNEKPEKLYADIVTKDIQMPSPYWDNVSEHAKNLIFELLDKSPITRLTPEEALNHKWIDCNTDIPKMHRTKTVEKLKEFNARKKLRSAIFSVQTIYRMNAAKRQIRQSSHDGTTNQETDGEDESLGKISDKERRSSTTVVSKTTYKDLPNRRKLSAVNVLISPRNVYVDLQGIKV